MLQYMVNNIYGVLVLKIIYFFYFVAVLSIINFIYDLVKLGTFDWSSLAIIVCMIGIATGLKKNTKNPQSKIN